MTDATQSESEQFEHYRATGTDGRSSLQQLAAERIAAHRLRRAAGQTDISAEATGHAAAGGTATNQAAQLQAAIEARQSLQDDPAARVREAVAARYRESQSYREYLAIESARALERARAEAEVAQRRADAMAEAQQQLLKELDAWKLDAQQLDAQQLDAQQADLQQAESALPVPPTPQPTLVPALRRATEPAPSPVQPPVPMAPVEDDLADGLSVQLFTPLATPEPLLTPVQVPAAEAPSLEDSHNLAELDEALAFRVNPDFSDHRIEIVPIQANILQFPRELVAPRKARPRLAEGPLRSDLPAAEATLSGDTLPSHNLPAQLRIFEVMPVDLAPALDEAQPVTTQATEAPAAETSTLEPITAPAMPALPPKTVLRAAPEALLGDAATAPGWQGVLPLEAPVRLPEAWPEHWLESAPSLLMPVYAAAIDRRLLCAIVDGCAVAAACITLATTALLACGHNVPHYPLWLLVPGTLFAAVAVAALYHWLFFTFSNATPGMLYARLSLCTFHNVAPTRRERQARVLAFLLAALPLGWGLVSMAFEIDHLGSHDKRSRMYPREY